jgi:serine/threonine protein kinase
MADRVRQQPGNYRLTSLLGQGNFSEVSLGEPGHLNIQVAMKVLPEHVAPPKMKGLLTEAGTLARVRHRHIVQIQDLGIAARTPLLVLDYATDGNLPRRHSTGELLSLDMVVPSVLHVAEALQYAYQDRLIHRDRKPEHRLLRHSNAIFLSDFALSIVAHHSPQQQARDTAGAGASMAPKQLQSASHPASDQYALGGGAYEWR